jgi:hypothetical protein
MTWNLFGPKLPPSETAQYEIKYVPFHPGLRREMRRAQTVKVVGDRAFRDTKAAIRELGGEIVRTNRSGR